MVNRLPQIHPEEAHTVTPRRTPVSSIPDQVREALRECGHRSAHSDEATAFLALADRLTDAGARRLRAKLR